ncbi:TonB domain protein [Methylocaldum marinum]|uniref:Protein TonB n=1 Tax=Methylocaldum marinum TaxID=1432792 RepID=A0A250KVX6_9GAMM|nr:energy transducer TonB [Methylocaldum marinum]BBA35828.1 TonB domain protein [Methylocaldum marinum]
MKTSLAAFPSRPGWVLAGAFAAAMVVNLALLLLIGALISHREAALISAPDPQPVDFIRIIPKTEEPKPAPPPEPAPMTEVAPEPRPTTPGPPPSGTAKPSAKKPARGAGRSGAPKSRKAPAPAPGTPAPRLDIPEQGTGAPFAPVPGSDPRLTAPPGQWSPDRKPGGEGEGTNGEGGTGGGGLVVISRVLPEYPPRARAQRIEGWVRLEIEVSPSGTVSAARVVAASPERVFDDAALKAIRRWRFQPAFSEGRAVSQRATLTMRFRLEER